MCCGGGIGAWFKVARTKLRCRCTVTLLMLSCLPVATQLDRLADADDQLKQGSVPILADLVKRCYVLGYNPSYTCVAQITSSLSDAVGFLSR